MYIYKITNTINNKIYIGLSTKSVEESINYLGSGEIQSRAIKKIWQRTLYKRNTGRWNFRMAITK